MVYRRDNKPLQDLRESLSQTVARLVAMETLDEEGRRIWKDFQPPAADDAPSPTPEEQDDAFEAFKTTLAAPDALERFDQALATAFAPFEQAGLLTRTPELDDQVAILVPPIDPSEPPRRVKVDHVTNDDPEPLRASLLAQFGSSPFEATQLADRLFVWLWPQWQSKKTETLTLDPAATQRVENQAYEDVQEIVERYEVGQLLVQADQMLGAEEIDVLRSEYEAIVAGRQAAPTQRIVRAVSIILLVFAMLVLCGVYTRYRQRGPLASFTRLTVILALAIITIWLARFLSAADWWRAEIVPLMLFGMMIAIVYRRELALLLSGMLALVLVVGIGHGLHEFLLLMGGTTAAVLNMGRIRSRSKLIYVGLFAAGVVAMLHIGLSLIELPLLDWPQFGTLLVNAGRIGLLALAAGFLMTGLLPVVEHLFGVLTDLSLLELGDVAHPLLQELVRRAPSTYNHSVTVGSIAEAAADSIGARGLLCRVGAYFHDIGKMLKPGYYIENQGEEKNRHDSLMPAMSSLVIVAHIKDGADLARQHHLPQPITDLIEQHHGTTLVGFFFAQASKQQQADPNGAEVDESTYRYPGPKPQTKEAGVLMLADNVESASRTLVDPTPARIESLVREVAQRRLFDGQFDESGLTLRELRAIEQSMIKSLIAIYHGRIKYPDQRTA